MKYFELQHTLNYKIIWIKNFELEVLWIKQQQKSLWISETLN